jgi:type VI secretion system ImpC/EvpB family protein
MVDIGSPAPDSRAAPEAPPPPSENISHTVGGLGAIVSAVARGARGERKHPRAVVGSAPEKVGHAYTRILTDLVQHPEVRRIERAWRGLRLLVEQCDFRAGVEVDVVPVTGPEHVEEALAALARAGATESERAPVDVVVVDSHVDATAVDLDRLARWADIAEQMRAPLLTNGAPGVLGVDSLGAVAKLTRRRSTSDDPRSVAVRGFAARDASRWVVLALNGALARAPYTASTSRVRDFSFAEDAADAESHLFVGAALVIAALCAKSYTRTGWPTQIVGPRDGQLGNLPVHEVEDRGQRVAIPLETFVSAEAQGDLAREGFLVLSSAANHDAAIVGKAPVVYRGPTAGARDDAPAQATLADQLFIGRFANAVEQLAAAIPADTNASAASEVARATLMELFAGAPPAGPEVDVKVDAAKHRLEVTVRPRRFAGIGIEEVTLGAPLGEH